jgi:hypothetical protein
MDTGRLIRHLTEGSQPAPPLPRPWVRTAGWLALSALYVALVVLAMSPRSDLVEKMTEARFVVEQVATLGTGVAAAIAAFASTIPGHSRTTLLLPVMPLAVWLGSLGQGCIHSWIRYGADGLSLRSDWVCFPTIALIGAVPAIAMALMLRRGAPLTPHLTAALGGLAAAGLGNFGLRFFHPEDASLMVLVWQFGTVFVLSALAGWSGRYLLSWRSVVGVARRRAAIG